MESHKPFSDWNLGPEYLIVKKIGQGGYGDVVEAIHRTTTSIRRVAIKRMKGIFCKTDIFSTQRILYANRVLRELVLLKRLKNPYIVELLDIIEPEDRDNFDEIYLVMELADIDFRNFIQSETILTLDEVRILTYKLLCCLNYLLSAKIIHRDLKPNNILVSNMTNLLTQERNPIE